MVILFKEGEQTLEKFEDERILAILKKKKNNENIFQIPKES